MVFDWLGILIFCLVFILLLIIIKTCFQLFKSTKSSARYYSILINKFNLEKTKSHLNSQNIKLANDFNDSIIKRLLWLVNKLISNQNIIFDK